ncbi:fic family toxin-antitoxin system, toxin component [Streptomyces sp. NPDC101151]|uniref:fic family toxin-antitoxin system, toxin component n=1 Tax=Streptomyces sp. NPDC101151 TaxID=3366115 RepID=UPI0037F3AADA
MTLLPHAAELLPGDPRVDDYGPLHAAVARGNARTLARDIHEPLHVKAAALLQTLVRPPCPEHSDEAFAWHAAAAYLAPDGCRLDHPPKEAVLPARDAASGATGVGLIGRQLRARSDS